MRQLSLFWKLYLSYLLVVVVALLMVVVGSYAVQVFRVIFLAQPVIDLGSRAHLSDCSPHAASVNRCRTCGGALSALRRVIFTTPSPSPILWNWGAWP